MSVPERVREFVRFKMLSVSAFCKSIDVSTSFVSSMSKSMSADKIQRISLHYPELNIGWLLTGEGEMVNTAISPVMPVSVSDVAHCRECDRKSGQIELLKENVRELQSRIDAMVAAGMERGQSSDLDRDHRKAG